MSARAQTRTEVITTTGGEGQVRGAPGAGSNDGSGSVRTGASVRTGGLKSGLGSGQAPDLGKSRSGSVSAEFSRTGPVSNPAPAGAEAEFSPSRRGVSSPQLDPAPTLGAVEAQSAPVLEPAGVLSGLEHAAEGVEWALSERAASVPGQAGGQGSDISLKQSLDKVFENARKAGAAEPDAAARASSPGSGPGGLVAGKVMDAETKIRRTSQVAGAASPLDAPDLYLSAVKQAEDTFPSRWAQAIGRAIRGVAERKAEKSLPALADGAYAAASQGSAPQVERSFKALDQWERLLGSPEKPLLLNRNHLESDVREILKESRSPGTPRVSRAGAPGRAKVRFSRDARTGTFTAMLPGTAVRSVPDLASAFSLSVRAEDQSKDGALRSGSADPMDEDLWEAFRADPSAWNGSKLVWRANRRAGASRPAGLVAAASHWLGRQTGAVSDFFRRATASRSAATPEGRSALSRDLRAVRENLSSVGLPRVRDARAAIESLAGLGRSYRAASSDPSILKAADALGARLEFSVRAEALGGDSPLPAALVPLVLGGGPGSLGHWADRASQALADAPAEARAEASALSPAQAQAARARIARTLSDAVSVTEKARAVAEWLAAHPNAAGAPRLAGRAVAFLAKTLSLAGRGGPVELTVLVDARSGRIAFARAENASGAALTAGQLSALLGVD